MVELASEPLYVLSQTQLRFKLRVAVEAAANTIKGALILLLLKFQTTSEVTALCLGQVWAHLLACQRWPVAELLALRTPSELLTCPPGGRCFWVLRPGWQPAAMPCCWLRA